MSAPKPDIATTSTAHHRWLSLIGIGEDGVAGLNPTARGLIQNAHIVFGGARHLALADELIPCGTTRVEWPSPITDALDQIQEHRGRPLVVLATGDPFHYGVGTLLANRFNRDEIVCVPQPSAFSLAASRLGWSVQNIALVTLHGRKLDGLNRHLIPGARILALSWDGTTPENVAKILTTRGLGNAKISVMSNLGGPREHIQTFDAKNCKACDAADLNTLAIEIPSSSEQACTNFARVTPGVDDDAFDNDGQITKRDIRVMTIAALNPRPGDHLWDIGLGAGSVAIEWLLCHASLSATGFERDDTRIARARKNAAALGVPDLEIIKVVVPDGLKNRQAPDAIFIGGGLSNDGVFEAAWDALKPGGRLVSNAVTLESQARLTHLHAQYGGELVKFEFATADKVGHMHGWRPAMPVVQWRVIKP